MIETNCVIKRIEYQADHRHGFQILGISTKTCQDEKRSTVTPTSSGFIPSPPGRLSFLRNILVMQLQKKTTIQKNDQLFKIDEAIFL